MLLSATPVDMWVASIPDHPGGLAQKLEALATAGGNLDFILARRCPEKPGEGVVFLTPLEGDKLIEAAGKAGFRKSASLFALRVEGPDEPGAAYHLTQALATEGINLRGLSAGRIGSRSVMYLAFDTADAAQKAAHIIHRL